MRVLRTPLCLLAILVITAGSTGTLSAHCGLPHHQPGVGDGTLTLFRPVTNERMTFAYRDAQGHYDQEVMEEMAQFFRCRLTGEIHPIDPGLIEFLDAIEDHFGRREMRLISAYRSPLRNHLMRWGGRRVASQSLHMDGRAADIQVVGIPPYLVRNFAYSLSRGGVGYYRRRHFIHVDVGPLRTWGWRPFTAPGAVHAATQK